MIVYFPIAFVWLKLVPKSPSFVAGIITVTGSAALPSAGGTVTLSFT